MVVVVIAVVVTLVVMVIIFFYHFILKADSQEGRVFTDIIILFVGVVVVVD